MGSAHEPQVNQIEFLNEKIDHADQMVLSDPVFETVRKQDPLPALNTFDETRNADPPKTCQSLPQNRVSTQPRLFSDNKVYPSLPGSSSPCLPRSIFAFDPIISDAVWVV